MQLTAKLPRYLRKWNSESSTLKLTKISQPTLMVVRIMLLVTFYKQNISFDKKHVLLFLK